MNFRILHSFSLLQISCRLYWEGLLLLLISVGYTGRAQFRLAVVYTKMVYFGLTASFTGKASFGLAVAIGCIWSACFRLAVCYTRLSLLCSIKFYLLCFWALLKKLPIMLNIMPITSYCNYATVYIYNFIVFSNYISTVRL